MIESSKDVLNLTLAFCSIWITVLLCWLLFYLISTIKKTHDVVSFLSKILISANDFITDLKQKAKGGVAYFKLFGVLTEKFLNYVEKKGTLKVQKFKDFESRSKNKKTQK